MHPCFGGILNVCHKKIQCIHKYIINTITTALNTCKNVFDFGQREVISFFTLFTTKEEHYYLLKVSKH